MKAEGEREMKVWCCGVAGGALMASQIATWFVSSKFIEADVIAYAIIFAGCSITAAILSLKEKR